MNEAATSHSQFDAAPDERVSFRTRLLVYCGIWLVAALISLLIPDSDFTFSEQARCALLAPLVAVFGLSLAVTFPHEPTALVGAYASSLLFIHGVATLVQTRQSIFRVLVATHLVILFTAAVYLIRFSHLPSGG